MQELLLSFLLKSCTGPRRGCLEGYPGPASARLNVLEILLSAQDHGVSDWVSLASRGKIHIIHGVACRVNKIQ